MISPCVFYHFFKILIYINCILKQIHENLKLFHWFLSGCGQNGPGHLFSSWDSIICCTLRMSVWIELIFCMLTVMQYFFVRPTLYSMSLTFKCQSTVVSLVRPPAVATRILWKRVCLSHCSGIFPDVFLELDHIRFPWTLTCC